MNDFDRRFAAAQAELAKTSMWSSNTYPPIQVLLGKLGLKTRPPHYAPFIVAFNISAISFAGVWGGFMWLLVWQKTGMSPDRAISTAVIAGVAFGLFMALNFARGRRKHNLTPWHKL